MRHCFRASVFLILCSFAVGALAHATHKSINHKQALTGLYQQLSVDRQRNKVAASQLAQLKATSKSYWQELEPKDATRNVLESRKLALAIAKTDVVNAEQTLADVKDQLQEVQNAISTVDERLQDAKVSALEKDAQEGQLERLQARLTYLNTYADLIYQRIRALQENVEINAKMVRYHSSIYERVSTLFHQHQNQLREQRLMALAEVIEKKKSELLSKLENYNQEVNSFKLEGRANAPAAIIVNTRIFNIEEQIYLSDLTLNYRKIQDTIADLKPIPGQRHNVSDLDARVRELESNIVTLKHFADRINDKLALIRDKRAVLLSDQSLQNNTEILQIFRELTEAYEQEAKQNKALLNRALRTRAQIQHVVSQVIAERQGLPGLDLYSWKRLFKKLLQLPSATMNAASTLRDHTFLAFNSAEASTKIALGSLFLFWFVCIWTLPARSQQWLTSLAASKQRSSARSAYIALQLLSRDIYLLITLVAVSTALVLLGVTFKYYKFLFYTFATYFAFRFAVGLARLTLVENYSNIFGQDVALYKRLKWAFLFGGIVTALTVLSYQLNVGYEVRDLMTRMLMGFLLLLSIILYRGRDVVPSLLEPYISKNRSYLKRATDLLSTLIPLAILSNAIIGLCGYIELAWVLSYYQAVVLIVIAAYVVVHGLLIDFIDLLAELAIRHLQNGWLLTQAFLKPLVTLIRIALLAIAVALVFRAFGLDRQSYIVQQILFVLNYNLLPFSTYTFSIVSILLFSVLVTLVFWVSRWTREFTYRYLFRDVRDQGIRNSLSLFIQYSLTLIGALLTLRVIGINLGDLSYILGGLAVGLGFGLRDFANNIVSGIMILIERPVREGDLVSVAGHEGRVTHIGIRSMVLRSWDNMEVMVPNAETLNKTFINWTHQDHIVRTQIPIRVHRDDDPVRVQALIMAVIREIPDILSEPEPGVLLRNIDDNLIELELRYFVNLEKSSRILVRSQVLYTLWERFKVANVHAPYPEQAIRIKPAEITKGLPLVAE